MARAWHLAPSLVRLRDEVNRRWPGRSKRSDGTIGDAAHSARVSDHNPNARGSVNAIDITRQGIDTDTLLAAAMGDPRTNYVIFDRVIYSRSRGFTPRTYTGSNPHTGHVHISILQSRAAEQDTRPWGIHPPPAPPTVVAPVTMQKGILGMTQHISRHYGTPQTIGTGDHYLRAHDKGWWWLHEKAGLTAVSVSGYATAGPNCQIFICAETDKSARVLGRAPLPDGTGSFSGSALATLREGEVLRLQVANHAGGPITISNVTTNIIHED